MGDNESGAAPSTDARATQATLLLEQTLHMLAPLVRLLVANGVGYPQLAQALKPAFVEAARAEIAAEGRAVTDAATSVRSGVHRKDVRALREASTHPVADSASDVYPTGGATRLAADSRRTLGVAEMVFTRWLSDAGYRQRDGRPASLPVNGPAPSFDALVVSVTRDVSRRTVLDELSALGLVRETAGMVHPLADAMTPRRGFAEVARYLAEHVGDHLAAGAANVDAVAHGRPAPFLEQSVYGRGLSPESLAMLSELARTLWRVAFNQMADAARQRYEIDRASPPAGEARHAGRMLFGAYFHADPLPGGDDPTRSAQ